MEKSKKLHNKKKNNVLNKKIRLKIHQDEINLPQEINLDKQVEKKIIEEAKEDLFESDSNSEEKNPSTPKNKKRIHSPENSPSSGLEEFLKDNNPSKKKFNGNKGGKNNFTEIKSRRKKLKKKNTSNNLDFDLNSLPEKFYISNRSSNSTFQQI